MNIFKSIYKFLSSYKLAMALLVTILTFCVVGVTIFRGEEAWNLIFNQLWFNGILVLLVVNVACCFFGRIWGRKVTLISFGMILFHLSFVAITAGIVYSSLFYFKGILRLTEGETLLNSDPLSYDTADQGRFFDFSTFKGETTLIKMHKDYMVNNRNKRVAYEVSVGEVGSKKKGFIYATQNLKYNGFRYFTDKVGHSIRVDLYDKDGRGIFAAHIPLQSHRLEDESYYHTTGSKEAPGSFSFPQGLVEPLFNLQAAFVPDLEKEMTGEVQFVIWPLHWPDKMGDVKPDAEGRGVVGEIVEMGDYQLSVSEVRYWVGMTVRYDPGLNIVLTSLWVGFGGLVITFFGRLRRGPGGRRSETG